MGVLELLGLKGDALAGPRMDVLDDLARGEVREREGVVARLHHLEVPGSNTWLPSRIDLLVLGRPVVHRANAEVQHELAGDRRMLVFNGVAETRNNRGTRPRLLSPIPGFLRRMSHLILQRGYGLPLVSTKVEIVTTWPAVIVPSKLMSPEPMAQDPCMKQVVPSNVA